MSNVTSHTKPESATKSTPVAKKRGRQSNKIANAFASLTSTPVSVESYAKEHGVSVAVLRQAKRFDKSGAVGQVHVKKDKESGSLMIWRSTESAEQFISS